MDSGSQLSLKRTPDRVGSAVRLGGQEELGGSEGRLGGRAGARRLLKTRRPSRELGGSSGSSAAPPYCCIVLARAAARPRALELETNKGGSLVR